MLLNKFYATADKYIFQKQLGRFLVIGGTTFVVNSILLFIFHGVFKLDLLLSQIIAAEISIAVSFTFHHHWTYRNYKERPLWIRFLSFNGSAVWANLIATLTLLGTVNFLGIHYLIGFSVGAILAAFWSYFANRYLIWSRTANDN